MQFYKHRDFGKIINDTIMFFKENWKNFFKNYFLINGLILILLLFIFFFGYNELISLIFQTGAGGQAYLLEEYFIENQNVLIISTLLLFVIFTILIMISYTYPLFYIKRMSETGVKKINADAILADMQANIKKYLKFCLGLYFIVFPAFTIIYMINMALVFIGIGIILFFVTIPLSANILNFLIIDYFHTDKSFFACLGYAIRSQFSYSEKGKKTPFWKYWGATSVSYIIVQTATSVFAIISFIIFIISDLTTPDSFLNDGEMTSGASMAVVLIYIISILASLVLTNFMYVNAAFMYYDSRIDLHREVFITEIDSIGSNEN